MLKILLLEDDEVVAHEMNRFLEQFGTVCTCTNIDNALVAFSLATKSPRPFDFVCLDIMVQNAPSIGLLKTMRYIEKEEKTKRCKIFITSAYDTEQYMKAAFNGMCDEYLVKPFSLTHLYDTMRLHGLICLETEE